MISLIFMVVKNLFGFLTSYHRIMEWLGLKRTLKTLQFPHGRELEQDEI